MIHQIIDFFRITNKDIWRHIVMVSLIIPIVLAIFEKVKKWYVYAKPLNQLLRGYKNSDLDILVYASQLTGATLDERGAFRPNDNQLYIIRYPSPTPRDQQHVDFVRRHNIDPVWPEAEGHCVADIFNVLGRINKFRNLRLASIINDWASRTHPVFTIGFNPKTLDLISECNPINYSLSTDGAHLTITGTREDIHATPQQDAGIVQKVFRRGTSIPVFILAGLGTAGTRAAGYFFRENCIGLGKLYRNKEFCVLLRTDITKGQGFYEIEAIYPKPDLLSIIFHPGNYYKWMRKKVFPNS